MWLREHALILVLFVLYTGVLVHHALIGQRRTRDLADFLVGGRSLGGVILGVSFFATYASTNSFIGFAGKAYASGIAWLLIVPTVVILSFVAWAWLAPRLRGVTETLGSVTIPDYIGFRFNSRPARFVAALIVIFSSFLYMTAVFKGIGSLLVELLDLSYGLSLFVVVLIVCLYTMIGGFHSVARTDFVQGILMTLAAVLMFFAITRAAGGIGRLADLAQIGDGALVRWDTAQPLGLLIGVVFASTVKLIVEPRQLSRFYALETEAAAKSGLVVSTLSFLVVFSLLAPLGLYAHFVVGQGIADTDQVIPMMLSDPAIFPPVAQAFLFLALVSAAMSSLDSVLLVMASTAQRDLLGLLVPADDRHAVRNTRICVVLFAAITADSRHRPARRHRRADFVLRRPLRRLLPALPGPRLDLAPRQRPSRPLVLRRRRRNAGPVDAARHPAHARRLPGHGHFVCGLLHRRLGGAGGQGGQGAVRVVRPRGSSCESSVPSKPRPTSPASSMLLRRVRSITITRRGRPVARLMPPAPPDRRRAVRAVSNLRALRRQIGWSGTVEEILALRDAGRRCHRPQWYGNYLRPTRVESPAPPMSQSTLNHLGQPVGPGLEGWTAPPLPSRHSLAGRYCRIEPLDPARHSDDLYEATAADVEGRIWTYLSYGPFNSPAEFRGWAESAATSEDKLFYAIVDEAGGRAAAPGVVSPNRAGGRLDRGWEHLLPAPPAEDHGRHRSDVPHDAE